MTAVDCVTLRPGREAPLFVIPGGDGKAADLAGLARALRAGPPVVALDLPNDGGVEALGTLATAAIRAHQPTGPYRLVGYSFGGLVALEAARQLVECGEEVALLGLIDTVYDRRFWPAGLFAAAVVRRTAMHLARLVRQPAREAIPELWRRTGALWRRLAGRAGAGRLAPADGASTGDWRAAMAAWRPGRAAAPVTIFCAARSADFGCDPAELWRPFAADLTIRRVDAAHLELMRSPRALAALAAQVDDALTASTTPRPLRVLLAASFDWPSTARLALGLTEAGFLVQAVCPRRHGLRRLGFVQRTHPLDPFRVQTSLARAIAVARPDLILPCDDRAAQALHALHQRADPAAPDGGALRDMIVRSLGARESFAQLHSRTGVMALAHEEGVACPATARVRNRSELAAWTAAHAGPAVLKTDGSWGGRELAFVDTPAEADRAFRRLIGRPGLLRAAKRLVVEGDAAPLKAVLMRRRPILSIQAFVSGAPGNAAVACLDGEVLGAVYAEVVRSDGEAGPATVVRVVDHRQMARAVRTLARRLGLSGLCGFDFILDPLTGEAQLIELNPRATPTAHLIGANGDDLLAALSAGLRRRAAPARVRPAYAGRLVALFPQELRRDPASGFLRSAHHDVPWHAPEVVELALARAQRSPLERLSRRLAPYLRQRA